MANFISEPPRGLLQDVLKRIHNEERFLATKKVIIFSMILVASVAGFVPSFKMLLSDFSQTGFLKLFSLAFSDFSIVSAYWKNFLMALLESLPALSVALALAFLLAFLQSIKSLFKNVKLWNQKYSRV